MLATLFVLATGIRAQENKPVVSTFMVNERPVLLTDSLGNRTLKPDTVTLEILMSFAHLVKEIKQVHFQIGDAADKGNVLDETLVLTNSGDKTYLTGLGMNNQLLSYGTNLAFTLKRKKYANGKWASVSYVTNNNITSVKTHFKIKN